MKETIIQVNNIIGDSFAVEAEDGQKVFERIIQAIKDKIKVNLSFKNIEMTTTAFLNTAIGQLYGEFKEEEIRAFFMVSNTNGSIENALKRVVMTAKLHYSDPDALQRSIDDIMNE